MGSPSRAPRTRDYRQLHIRLRQHEKDAVEAAAAKDGITLTMWVRRAIIEWLARQPKEGE